jgi:hypothetical protein
MVCIDKIDLNTSAAIWKLDKKKSKLLYSLNMQGQVHFGGRRKRVLIRLNPKTGKK